MTVLSSAGKQRQKKIQQRKENSELQERAGDAAIHLHSKVGVVGVRKFLHQDGTGLTIQKGDSHQNGDCGQPREDTQPRIGLSQAPELILAGIRFSGMQFIP